MKYTLITLAALSGTAFAQTNIDSDFSFMSGEPVSGTMTQNGVTTSVTTTHTAMYGATAIRDAYPPGDPSDATVTLTFSQKISDFSLDVSYVAADEFIQSINVGDPTSLTGDLIQTASGVSTSNSGDSGYGVLSWSGLNTDTISFVVSAPNGALAMNRFTATTVVPEPSSAALLGLGGLALILRRRK